MGLEQQIAGRVDGIAAEFEAAARAWEREQRLLWGRLRARIEALSGRLLMAKHACDLELGTHPARDQRAVAAAFGWLDQFDRERSRISDEVWALVRAARDGDRRWRRALAVRLAEIDGLRADVKHHAEAAAEDAVAQAAPLASSPAAAGVRAHLDQTLAAMRGDFAGFGRDLETGVAGLLAARHPDWEQAAARFAEAMTGRFGGAAAPAPRPRAPMPAGGKRKHAKIPKFLLNRFYKKGGLRPVPGGVEISFVNPLAFCIVQGGDAIVFDGRRFPKADTEIDNGAKKIAASALSATQYLKFPKGAALKVTLAGLTPARGRHHFTLSLEMRKLGWVDLDFEDEI